jgi:hypothetical protein
LAYDCLGKGTVMRRQDNAGIALISAATMMFELALTRIFAVAEWYHFAFLSISVALLGYASSGSFLALLRSGRLSRLAPAVVEMTVLAFPWLIFAAYGVVNGVPFDSYRLAWDPRQLLYVAIYYLGLILPFAASGLVVAHYLALQREGSHTVYAANLAGSALGAVGLLAVLPNLGGEGAVAVAGGLGALGGLGLALGSKRRSGGGRWASLAVSVISLVVCAVLAWVQPTWMTVRMSPYKSLRYALQSAGARLAYRRWNAYSRVDVVESASIHSFPGLSLRYQGNLPPQHGLTVDGDNLAPLSRRQSEEDLALLAYLPSSIPYQLRPRAAALILQPGGGMDVAVALQMGARQVSVVEQNPLVVQVVRDVYDAYTGRLYRDPRVDVRVEDARSVLQRGRGQYDIVQFSLNESYHPLASGAYSLSENYVYTVEAMRQALGRLEEDGVLVVTRWLQDPPSESLRAAAILVTVLEQTGVQCPADHLMAFRSWSTVTLLASPVPWSGVDVDLVRQRCEALGYDPVYYPGMPPEEANRYNVLPRPYDYEAIQALLAAPGSAVPGSAAQDRQAFYQSRVYDVSPTTDDRPFFGHFFRWRQVPAILAQLGRTWQPFGGSGYLLVWALLLLALLAAIVLVILPLRWAGRRPPQGPLLGHALLYFVALGLGYILVEMPLLQQFILYLGQPTLAFSTVITTLLFSSGLGSLLAPRLPLRPLLLALIAAIVAYPLLLRPLFQDTMALGWGTRLVIAVTALVPLGLLMGVPFVGGLRSVQGRAAGLTPWVWAVNGSASVVGSILAAVLALSWGYRSVLAVAAACYAVAWCAAAGLGARPMVLPHELEGQRPRP